MADLTQAMIESWILNEATGKFHYTKVLDGLIDPKLYPQVRTILHRLKEKNVTMPVDGRDEGSGEGNFKDSYTRFRCLAKGKGASETP